MNTDNKFQILDTIIMQNSCKNDNGNLFIDVTPGQINTAISLLVKTITNVMDMRLLTQNTIVSMFSDHLNETVTTMFKDKAINPSIKMNHIVDEDGMLSVDYLIECPNKRPIFLYGVRDDNKASKVIIYVLNFIKMNMPFSSLIVNDDDADISKFHQKQLTNAADKQFTSLRAFRESGYTYFERELRAG